ncbi:hypothetical protein NPX13_g3146 [Xylaria arbuscula]|uniref:Heterokaryon incompatibility domain-containing protein n=1 Tax=Xylaria arbuscula TaxID=114810 RepID=A0A9W8NIG3_9PEZI|nr:hypothetical protein NPX13_g3146 [Xylaria arbuscula]
MAHRVPKPCLIVKTEELLARVDRTHQTITSNPSTRKGWQSLSDLVQNPVDKGQNIFNISEDLELIELAITDMREFLDRVCHSPSVMDYKRRLAIYLMVKYLITDDTIALYDAANYLEEAAFFIIDDVESADYLSNLSVVYMLRYNACREFQDLETSIAYRRRSHEAMRLLLSSGDGDDMWADSCNGLSDCLLLRYRETKSIEDLEEAFRLAQETLRVTGDTASKVYLDANGLVNDLLMEIEKIPITEEGLTKERRDALIDDLVTAKPSLAAIKERGHREEHADFLKLIVDHLNTGENLPDRLLSGNESFLPETELQHIRPDGHSPEALRLPALTIMDSKEGRLGSLYLGDTTNLEFRIESAKAFIEGALKEDNDNGEVETGINHLNDGWMKLLQDEFAVKLLRLNSWQTIPHRPSQSTTLCGRCSRISIMSAEFEIGPQNAHHSKPLDCSLCALLLPFCKSDERVDIYREGSTLKTKSPDRAILTLCAKPSQCITRSITLSDMELTTVLGLDNIPDDIQLGYPILPEPGSLAQYDLLREWIHDCDQHHSCCDDSDHGQVSSSKDQEDEEEKCLVKPESLPSMVLDVGCGSTSTTLRLHISQEGEKGRYVTLSHCWGGMDAKSHSTFKCNLKSRTERIIWEDLPKTFQDAITVTRELGIRYLWIDSLCIAQPHKDCLVPRCADYMHWLSEAKRMELSYGRSYCTLAATSGIGPTQGLLYPRPVRRYAILKDENLNNIYVCENIDDFESHVENAPLNKRGWVLQERALSRRTIHFTHTQTYWECREGIRCESLTALRNGLLERIGIELCTETPYGIINRYLHRSLLWKPFQKSGSAQSKRIQYPEGQKVPSWSWMTFTGEISYEEVPFYEVDWNEAVQYPWREKPSRDIGPKHAHGTGLKVLVHEFSQSAAELSQSAQKLSFNGDDRGFWSIDEGEVTRIFDFKCVVLGRMRALVSLEKQLHFVLVVKPLAGMDSTYERVGIGSVQKRDILFSSSCKTSWII